MQEREEIEIVTLATAEEWMAGLQQLPSVEE